MNLQVDNGKQRLSNIELYRIIVMLAIVAHHYVVNSDINTMLFKDKSLSIFKTIFLFVFGAWGKTGITCFVLITGYFMCMQNITLKKWLTLFFTDAHLRWGRKNVIMYIVIVKTDVQDGIFQQWCQYSWRGGCVTNDDMAKAFPELPNLWNNRLEYYGRSILNIFLYTRWKLKSVIKYGKQWRRG